MMSVSLHEPEASGRLVKCILDFEKKYKSEARSQVTAAAIESQVTVHTCIHNTNHGVGNDR